MSRADAATLAARAGEYIDLIEVPFTRSRSRIVVTRDSGGGLAVQRAEYERPLRDCVVLAELVVRDTDGIEIPVASVLPDRIEFGRGVVSLTFAGPDALSLGGESFGVYEVSWRSTSGNPERRSLGGEHSSAIRFDVDAMRRVSVRESDAHDQALGETRADWIDWFERCPVVRDDLQNMAAFCWWVLGANTVELPELGDARAIVPSKIGYVGLWQWDAYFIAVGVRHGDAALAREQLELAFRFPSNDGQLPDVVHDDGVLRSSDDLPSGDRETLRRAGSDVADPERPVPLTKPPLAAWALAQVLEMGGDDEWARAQIDVVRRSQAWWFATSDLDGDGMPEYGHPYSSGLDDNPIFDGPLPTASPDLAAYLIVQDLELAGLVERYGVSDPGADVAALAAGHRTRAAETMQLLLEMWNDERGVFEARAAGSPVATDSIVGLLPLLTGLLPERIVRRLVEAISDPARFGTRFGIPTVAATDPSFSPERMWRGPVWVNTNALLAAGLRASGERQLAEELAERTLALVVHGGGPHEYFNPETGRRARTATTAFGWSAALFLDLAVRASTERE